MARSDVRIAVGLGLLAVLAIVCAPPEGKVSVARVDLGTAVDPDQRVVRPARTFAPGSSVHASVVTNGSGLGVEIKVRWVDRKGRLIAEKAQMISPRGPVATSFTAEPPGGWSIGRYEVQVLLDGRNVAETEFEIKNL